MLVAASRLIGVLLLATVLQDDVKARKEAVLKRWDEAFAVVRDKHGKLREPRDGKTDELAAAVMDISAAYDKDAKAWFLLGADKKKNLLKGKLLVLALAACGPKTKLGEPVFERENDGDVAVLKITALREDSSEQPYDCKFVRISEVWYLWSLLPSEKPK